MGRIRHRSTSTARTPCEIRTRVLTTLRTRASTSSCVVFWSCGGAWFFSWPLFADCPDAVATTLPSRTLAVGLRPQRDLGSRPLTSAVRSGRLAHRRWLRCHARFRSAIPPARSSHPAVRRSTNNCCCLEHHKLGGFFLVFPICSISRATSPPVFRRGSRRAVRATFCPAGDAAPRSPRSCLSPGLSHIDPMRQQALPRPVPERDLTSVPTSISISRADPRGADPPRLHRYLGLATSRLFAVARFRR